MSEVISIRTWISIASVVAFLTVLTVPGTAQLLEEPEVTGDVPETGFVLPEYETPREIVFEFALPFLLIAFILNIGLKQALFTTTVEPDENLGETLMNELTGEGSSRAATASRRARILSLVITGMLVPTKIFQLVNNFVSLVFGSVFFIVILAASGLFLYTLFRSILG
jgi:hypothetical protein